MYMIHYIQTLAQKRAILELSPQLSLFVKLVCLRQSLQYEVGGLIARASEFKVTGPGLMVNIFLLIGLILKKSN